MDAPNFTKRTVGKPTPPPSTVPLPPGVPPSAVAAQLPFDPNLPPIPTGTMVMTDNTRAQLRKLGWKDGDPLPGDLNVQITEIQRRIEAEVAAASPNVPPNYKPVKPGKIVDISELPPEYQEELRQSIVNAKAHMVAYEEYQARQNKIESMIPEGAAPSVAQAIRENAAAAFMPSASVAPIRTPEAMVTEALPPGDGRKVGSVDGISPVFAQLEQAKQAQAASKQPEAPAPEPPAPEPSAGGELPLSHCPRCLHDLRLTIDVVPTEADKLTFTAGLLGGQRFVKEYSHLGNNLTMTFRSLTVRERQMVNQQLTYDIDAGKIRGDAEYFLALMEYRMIMELASLASADGKMTKIVPEIKTIPYEPPADGSPETPLVPMKEWFYDEIVNTESLQHMVSTQYREFQRLVEVLEARSKEEGFVKGIVPSR